MSVIDSLKSPGVDFTTEEILKMQFAVEKFCSLPFKDAKQIIANAIFWDKFENLANALKKAEVTLNRAHIQHTNSGHPKMIRGEVEFFNGTTAENYEKAVDNFRNEKHKLEIPTVTIEDITPFLTVSKDNANQLVLTGIEFARLKKFIK